MFDILCDPIQAQDYIQVILNLKTHMYIYLHLVYQNGLPFYLI